MLFNLGNLDKIPITLLEEKPLAGSSQGVLGCGILQYPVSLLFFGIRMNLQTCSLGTTLDGS